MPARRSLGHPSVGAVPMAEPSSADTAAFPVRVVRYGRDEPLPERRLLQAGPLTAVLEGGDLRYVAVGGREVVRRLYVAVRDRDWGTVPVRYEAYEAHQDGLAFVVRFTAVHDDGDAGFTWEGRITGTSAGVVTLSMDGVATRTFLRNRIGWCLLHPMDLAGVPVEVEHPNGATEPGVFPTAISPHQPFFDIVAMEHAAGEEGDGRLAIRFAGDLFEMEDQRNWTDASYKTYSTPLREPYPVSIGAGERVAQSVTLAVAAGASLALALGGEPGAEAMGVAVTVDAEPGGSLPPIGLAIAFHRAPPTEVEIARLRALAPAHLRAKLDATGEGWEERLGRAAEQATALGAGLELEVLTGDGGEGLERLVPVLAALGVPLARLLVFPASGLVTTAPVLDRARRLLTEAGSGAPVGGGSRAYFTQLNRAAAELPLAGMDVVGYSVNPQVHAFDEASLVETLAALATTVESARAIAGDRPLVVGPVTLRPRFNPDATGPAPEVGPEELPPSVDPRQLSLFAAGWTVGALRRLAAAGADALTFYETIGWRGVMERSRGLTRRARFPSQPGMLFPLYHVLADAAEFAGAALLPVATDAPLAVEALALRAGGRLRILVASFRDESTRVTLSLPALTGGRLRLLDETTYAAATGDGDTFRRRVDRVIEDGAETIELELRPFAVATIDGVVAGAAP